MHTTGTLYKKQGYFKMSHKEYYVKYSLVPQSVADYQSIISGKQFSLFILLLQNLKNLIQLSGS